MGTIGCKLLSSLRVIAIPAKPMSIIFLISMFTFSVSERLFGARLASKFNRVVLYFKTKFFQLCLARLQWQLAAEVGTRGLHFGMDLIFWLRLTIRFKLRVERTLSRSAFCSNICRFLALFLFKCLMERTLGNLIRLLLFCCIILARLNRLMLILILLILLIGLLVILLFNLEVHFLRSLIKVEHLVENWTVPRLRVRNFLHTRTIVDIVEGLCNWLCNRSNDWLN